MKAKNIKVTTTSGFDGVEIDEYLEPITAHVVVGMNFFKDFLGGLTDFFGGNSKTYQNTLSSINDEVINELRKKAHSIGANCILGLKIDNDEVSAQGKSMMMVTALGTAAKANFSIKQTAIIDDARTEIVSNDALLCFKQKHKYIVSSKNNTLVFDDKFWEFVKTNTVSELASYLLSKYIEYSEAWKGYKDDELSKFSANINDYFCRIDPDYVIDCLYSNMLGEKKINRRRVIINKIRELHLVDFDKIKTFIECQDFELQKSAIQILNGEKDNYDKSDIQRIDDLITVIESSFKEKGSRSTKKKLLSSKDKEIWNCECGNENDGDELHCSSCKNDIYGFNQSEINPLKILEKLKYELYALKSIIK